jgi:hypothetical protein
MSLLGHGWVPLIGCVLGALTLAKLVGRMRRK